MVMQLRKSFPATITSDTVKKLGLAPNNESYVINVLQFIGSTTDSATLDTERMKAKEFIVRRYTGLMGDLSKGSGEDLTSLLSLMHVQTSQEAEARRKIRALSEVYTDAAIFADHATDLHMK